MNFNKLRLETLYKASIIRHFESKIYKYLQKKKIKFPVYFSSGQEYVACSIASGLKINKIKPMLFGQHRGHSIYLGFGGDLKKLILEFSGSKNGCTFGMGGSLSIHSPKINMYGHDGFMGSNVCIGVGASFSTKKPSIIFIGDADQLPPVSAGQPFNDLIQSKNIPTSLLTGNFRQKDLKK